MKHLYFETINGNLVTNYDVANACEICCGCHINADNFEMVRSQAETMKGIKRELVGLTPEKLLDMGYYARAIQLYREMYDVSVTEAKKAVDEMRQKMKGF